MMSPWHIIATREPTEMLPLMDQLKISILIYTGALTVEGNNENY